MTDEEWAEYNARPETVSREEQERRGLLPVRRPGNYVGPGQAHHPPDFRPHQVDMNVNHPATQHVDLRTSATDRAKGFQIAITPISFVVSFFALLVSFGFNDEWLSLVSLWIFVGVFAFVYVVGWGLTALVSPEFISLYSARRQWNVIDREQVERWAHFKWQSGRTDAHRTIDVPGTRKGLFSINVASVEVPGWALFVAGLAGFVVAILYLMGV